MLRCNKQQTNLWPFFQDNLGELVSETVKDSSFNSVVLCASNYSVRTDPEPGKFQSPWI